MKIVCQCDKSTASYGTTKKIVRKQWHKVTEKENREREQRSEEDSP